MKTLLLTYLPYLQILACWLLVTGIANLVARKSQVDAWCEARPRLAGLLKIARGMGFCPWLVLQGLSLIFTSKLPPSLRKLIPILFVLPLLVGCIGSQ